MRVNYSGRRIEFTMAYRIDAAKWDVAKQREKNGCTNKLKDVYTSRRVFLSNTKKDLCHCYIEGWCSVSCGTAYVTHLSRDTIEAQNPSRKAGIFCFYSIAVMSTGPCPIQLVVVSAVRAAVRAATAACNSTSQILFFFITQLSIINCQLVTLRRLRRRPRASCSPARWRASFGLRGSGS